MDRSEPGRPIEREPGRESRRGRPCPTLGSMASEIVEMEGHIIDSLILAKVLDLVLASGADYEVLDMQMGRSAADPSRARIEVRADNAQALASLLEELQAHGANRAAEQDASVVATDRDGVLPAGFYSTTNLPTWARLDGTWVKAASMEMDCGLLVGPAGPDGEPVLRALPMHKARAGDRFVVGTEGVRVEAPEAPRDRRRFEFMASDVSSEKPKGLAVQQVAERMRSAHAAGGRILAVAGPAVVHTGAGPDMAQLVGREWVDVLFAGNGFATHDMESNVLGTSLGVQLGRGTPAEGGHANHLRVINEVRRHGSIAAAVKAGYVTGGVMYECVRAGVPFVLAGSLRDDGPLPDVQSDVLAAADSMRELLGGVRVVLMLASTLHAIATGNILAAGVDTFCIDINQAVATKLADRGSHQALGIVTDVGLFLHELAVELCGGPDRTR